MPEPTAVVPSILEPDGAAVLRRIHGLSPRFRTVEVRGDLLDREELLRSVADAGREVIVAIRRSRDGGRFEGSEEERIQLLLACLDAGAGQVDLELDCMPAVSHRIDRRRLILSWHGRPGDRTPLDAVWARMLAAGAGRYKLVPRADDPSDPAAIRRFLGQLEGRSDLTCFASGRPGAISRILAPSWGSERTYGYPQGAEPTAEGQFPAEFLDQVLGVSTITRATRIYGLLGRDLAASPSPAMHNAALRALDIDARYLPMEIDSLASLETLASPDGPVRGCGFGVTAPFKEPAAALAVRLDRWSRLAGACNTLVPVEGGWSGHNTDAPAILALSSGSSPVRGRSALVYGAGGTGRTAATVLREAGARVVLAGRNRERVAAVAGAIGVQAAGEQAEPRPPDILVNATPVGARGEPWNPALPLPARLVLDVPYGFRETDLVTRSRAAGLEVASGRDLVLAQALEQFRLLTGKNTNRAIMAEAMERWFAGHCA